MPVPLFQEGSLTIQPPPIYPSVKFQTTNNSKKEIRVYLSPTKGWMYDDFKMIMEEDAEQLLIKTIKGYPLIISP